jgi:hypothetical protein
LEFSDYLKDALEHSSPRLPRNVDSEFWTSNLFPSANSGMSAFNQANEAFTTLLNLLI